jgi:sugar-specific transcriptional regulator TrmB
MDFDITEIGMTKNEGRVYLALLELGPSLAGQISRKTGLHRRNVYDITERLIQKGIIGYIKKNNRKLFEAASPQRLKEIIDEKQKSLQEVMPELNELYQKTKEKQETNFYKGTEGLKTIFRDQLQSKEILILGASNSAFEILPFYFKWYDRDRKKKKIKVRIIANKQFNKSIPLSEMRYLPEKYSNPLAINIWQDKVAIILWKSPPLAIVIKNKEIADSYKKYFELIWNSAKKN